MSGSVGIVDELHVDGKRNEPHPSLGSKYLTLALEPHNCLDLSHAHDDTLWQCVTRRWGIGAA